MSLYLEISFWMSGSPKISGASLLNATKVPDHEATGEAVVRTVGRMPKNERPRLTLVAFSNVQQFLLQLRQLLRDQGEQRI
jgi:hypothetical protein